MKKWLSCTLTLLVWSSTVHTGSVIATDEVGNDGKALQQAIQQDATVYELDKREQQRWKISNDGTHPVETTKGMNEALKWAHQNGKTTFKVPAGTYLVDKNSQINMVSNMTFWLDDQAVLQKETNGKEHYVTLFVGYGTNNVTLKGGTYRGDKDTHDYSGKDYPYSAGTHESGYGILSEGAINLTIDGVKAENFTGDGLCIGGKGTMIKDLYAGHFESGAIDSNGKLVSDSTKIRIKEPLSFNNPIFKTERGFEFSNAQNLTYTFDVYFYKSDGTFLSSLKNQKVRQIMQIPDGASYFQAVFNKSSAAGAYVEYWNKVVSKNVVVRNSEFAFNRRQGITVGGGDHIVIANNEIHDIGGIAPQSGIDVEGGFGENGHRNSNIFIKDNNFYKNRAYDVILFDGQDATVEGNHLGSKGAIGLAISTPFTGAKVKNNHFDGTRIIAYHDATFIDNKMNDSFTLFEGPNITIDRMTFTDSLFSISSKVPFGVKASNITIYNTKKSDSGLSVWSKPVCLSNITIIGQPALRAIGGGSEEGSIFDNLKIIGYNSAYNLDLPRGTYNNCVFEAAAGGNGEPAVNKSGKYVFNGCSFKTNGMGLGIYHKDADVTVKNSTFNILGNAPALSVQSAKKAMIENNTINANHLTNADTEIIKINDYWQRTNPYDVLDAVIKGNTLTSNMIAKGISTIYAGIGAPGYTIENNILYNAKLHLRKTDRNINNQELIK
ncbi:right-handed parallel beta-helix repeat-containing protein [Bacillus songklensis]|uniref:Right-handed parallel beta-helix repeat-containing protein n=1 Tax=Bacillus songklensis TaxID=1069116 RepID=A0ABV8B4H4_9BACI